MTWGLGIATCFCSTPATASAVKELEDRLPVLNVSFDRAMFYGVNENDAIAGLKIWTRHFTEYKGIDIQVKISSYETREELDDILADGLSDVILMDTLFYSETEQTLRDTITPLFVNTVDDVSPYESYHLITHTDSGITTCEDLIGKNVLLLESNRAHLMKSWFFNELNHWGLDSEDIYTQGAGNISKALLPVFFKKSDACVVNDTAYELMKEFNPQLGRHLNTVMTSPDFTELVLCMRKDYQFEREAIIDSIASLHSDDAGRQMMMVFKISQFIPYQSNYINTVDQLLQSLKEAQTIRRANAR